MVDSTTTRVAVAVRIRPLNENEISNDVDSEGVIQSVECINAITSQKQIIAGGYIINLFDLMITV